MTPMQELIYEVYVELGPESAEHLLNMNPLQELIHEMYVEFVPESVKKND
jgi:hypothetical protein